MSDDFTRDLLNTDTGKSELSPGAIGRRWEPEEGLQKYRERIHRESKYADDNKNLPFTFSKPKKKKRSALVKCKNCGYVFSATVETVGVICRNCKKFSSTEVID